MKHNNIAAKKLSSDLAEERVVRAGKRTLKKIVKSIKRESVRRSRREPIE